MRIFGCDGQRIVEHQLDVFGGDAVGELDGFGERLHQDDGAEFVPAVAGDVGARQQRDLAVDFDGDGIGERRVGGDEDRLRAAAMLGLGQEIGGDPGRDWRICRR